MLTITYQDALAALRAAVDEKAADYVYEKVGTGAIQCVYRTEDNQPSCIVGNVLVRLGVPLEDLPSPTGIQRNAKALLGRSPGQHNALIRGVEATLSAATLLDEAQWRQDEGIAWGEAVELAVLNVPEGPDDRN